MHDRSVHQPTTEQELRALVRLLDDSDPVVTTAVQQRLVEHGHAAVSILRELIATAGQTAIEAINAEACLRAIRTAALGVLVDDIMTTCVEHSELDLERAVLNLSAFGYPETDRNACGAYLDSLALATRKQMTGSSPLEELLALNTVLFEYEQFRGAIGNFYSPVHTYIGPLLHNREGIPITLSVLYMLVAQRLDIELHGIGMPLHFLLYHPGLDVFIDCFNAGSFISHSECRKFIEHAGFTFNDSMLEKRNNIEIIQRMMRNAIYAHSKAGQQWEADTLQEALDTITHLIN